MGAARPRAEQKYPKAEPAQRTTSPPARRQSPLRNRADKRSDLVASFNQKRYQHLADIASSSRNENVLRRHTDGSYEDCGLGGFTIEGADTWPLTPGPCFVLASLLSIERAVGHLRHRLHVPRSAEKGVDSF